MTLSLENLNPRTTVLSSQLFERILDTVDRISALSVQNNDVISLSWDRLQQDFRQLINRYQDYLRDFYSSQAEHILQTSEFLPYKDKVIRYLQEFVLELQRHAEKIRRILLCLPDERIADILEQVYAAQKYEGEGHLIQQDNNYDQQLRDQVYGFWNSFYHWFVPAENSQSDSQHVLDLANDIIQRILMNAKLILQTHSGSANRKNEHQKFLEFFRLSHTGGCPSPFRHGVWCTASGSSNGDQRGNNP